MGCRTSRSVQPFVIPTMTLFLQSRRGDSLIFMPAQAFGQIVATIGDLCRAALRSTVRTIRSENDANIAPSLVRFISICAPPIDESLIINELVIDEWRKSFVNRISCCKG